MDLHCDLHTPHRAWRLHTGASRRDTVAALAHDPALADALTAHLADLPLTAAFLELAPLGGPRDDAPFEAMVLQAPDRLAAAPADPSSFRGPLAHTVGDPAVFPNLGGDTLLVVPRPPDGPLPDWGHLLAWVRDPGADTRGFWHAAAHAALGRADAHGPRPTWVSTSGLAVPWLHLRLDPRPKYITWAPYRRVDASAPGA